MEDVLEVYHRPHDPARPLVCLDEASKQLVAETREAIAVEPGKPKRVVQYEKGTVVGVARDYYADGALKREVPFKDNAMHGTEKQYAPNGTLLRTREWSDGSVVPSPQ